MDVLSDIHDAWYSYLLTGQYSIAMFYIAAMPLPDTMFCAQQIDIAQELPDILKNFTKAAVRTQPEDLLLWSAA